MPCTPPACPEGPLDRDSALAMCTRLRELSVARGVLLRSPPCQPDSCCGRGCTGCVWESYYAAVAGWRRDALIALGLQAAA